MSISDRTSRSSQMSCRACALTCGDGVVLIAPVRSHWHRRDQLRAALEDDVGRSHLSAVVLARESVKHSLANISPVDILPGRLHRRPHTIHIRNPLLGELAGGRVRNAGGAGLLGQSAADVHEVLIGLTAIGTSEILSHGTARKRSQQAARMSNQRNSPPAPLGCMCRVAS
jgi:hypothetical protein